MFSELIFNGQIGDLRIGASLINSKLKLENITEEEGDIPSLFNLRFKNEDFQITVLKNIVVGILYDFEYEQKKLYNIAIQNKKYRIGHLSNFKEFTKFITQNQIEHKITYSENNDCAEIEIVKSKIHLRFVNSNYSNLCKVWNFDKELYDEISTEIKTNI